MEHDIECRYYCNELFLMYKFISEYVRFKEYMVYAATDIYPEIAGLFTTIMFSARALSLRADEHGENVVLQTRDKVTDSFIVVFYGFGRIH